MLLGADFCSQGWGQGAAGTGVSCEALGWVMDPSLLGWGCGWMHPCWQQGLWGDRKDSWGLFVLL